MGDVLLGVLLVLAGAWICLNGQSALRLLIAVWGALAGFALGAGLVTALTGDGFLSTAFGWILGLVLAVICSALAYLYFAVAVIVSMASAGFALGGAIASAVGFEATWVLVLAGTVLGLAVALLAIVANLPQLVLIIAAALIGASAVVTGLTLLLGVQDRHELTEAGFSLADHPWWYALFLVLVIVGLLAQSRRADAALRQHWVAR